MPIFIKDKSKLVFIHIPKCAGSTITNTFEINGYKVIFNMSGLPIQDYLEASPQHLLGEQLKNLVDYDKVDSVFTIVRNPYERLISEYKWTNRKLNFDNYPNFNDWVSESIDKAIEISNYSDNHFRTMSEFIKDINNCKIFKYEDGVEKVFEEYISQNMEFKIINKNEAKKFNQINCGFNYFLKINTLEKLNKFYEIDFKTFSYSNNYLEFICEKYKNNLNLEIDLTQEIKNLERKLNNMENSFSWKITKPARAIYRKFYKLLNSIKSFLRKL